MDGTSPFTDEADQSINFYLSQMRRNETLNYPCIGNESQTASPLSGESSFHASTRAASSAQGSRRDVLTGDGSTHEDSSLSQATTNDNAVTNRLARKARRKELSSTFPSKFFYFL